MRPSPSNLSAVVLAGGRSSRMGRDKAAIAVAGVPLLTRTCRFALAIAPKVCVVTSTPDRYRALVPEPCQIAREPEAFQGPLAGLLCSWPVVPAEWVLVLACDLPNLPLEKMQKWAAQLPDIPPEAIAYLPRGTKGWEPLCGFYRDRAFPLLHRYWETGGRSIQRWLQARPDIATIPDVPPDALFNCNTPADLEQWRSEQGEQVLGCADE